MLGQENWLPNNLINTNFNQKIVQKTSQAGFELVEGRLPQVTDKFFEVEDRTLPFENGLSEVDDKSGENLRRIRNDDSPSSSIAFGFHFLRVVSQKHLGGVGGLGTSQKKCN